MAVTGSGELALWEGLVIRLHHDGCTRGQTLVILSLMAVCEEGGPGVYVVIRGF